MPARIRWSASIAVLLVTAVVLGANAFNPNQAIRHVNEVRKLSASEAARNWPVEITGVVTALSGWKNSFFLQESGTGISVDRTDSTEVSSGDQVKISGVTGAGLFAPVIIAQRVNILRHGTAPLPRPAAYADLAKGKEDSQWIQIEGTVRSAAIANSWGRPVLFLRIDTGLGLIMARVHDFANRDYSNLVDATVQVRGVCGTNFNERRQFVGLRLFVPDMSDVLVKEAPKADPFAIPESAIGNLFRFTVWQVAAHRVKVSGVVTYSKPGALFYLQSSDQGIGVMTGDRTSFEPGARVEAAGFVESGEYSPVLEDAIVHKIGNELPPKPVPITGYEAIQSKNGFPFAPYDGLLVETSGEVISQLDHQGELAWYVRDGKTVFEAQLERTSHSGAAPSIREGNRVRLTGICSVVTDQNREPKSFRILLRSSKDIVVTSRRWINPANAVWLIGILVLICFATLVWAVQLRRALVGQTARAADPAPSLGARLRSASKWFAISVIAGALIVLIGGWALHIRFLIGIRANTALGLMLVGLGIRLYDYQLNRGGNSISCKACLSTAALLGLLTLTESISGVDLGIDHILFKNLQPVTLSGRMPPLIAICLLSFALGGWLLWYTRRILIAQGFILAAATVCLMDALGTIYGASNVLGLTQQQDLPFVSALAALTISFGLLFSRPESGIMKAVSSAAPGGILARRLLPGAILIPAILGWLRWQGQLKGLYGTNTGLILFTSATVVVFSALIWMNAGLLNRLDIDRLRAETQSRIAEEANRAKGEFLAVVSHEIRTPMNSILGMADILRESRLDASQQRYVDVLRRAASNLMSLINDILDLSKIEAGKIELEQIDFDVKEVAEQAIELIEAKARAKGLELRIDFEQDLETCVVGDPIRLRQVLINLLGNAVKFTEKGSIVLTGRRAAGHARAVRFAVSDTGIGIAADKLESIFGDFTQADSSTTRKYGGTGMGLAISRRLVELMGGRIAVTSSPGEGSTFEFTLPFERGQRSTAQTPERPEHISESRTGRPVRILIADDSEENRLLIEIYLKETRHILTFAGDGRSAVTEFQKAHFDLVLMDMRMPVMDGLAATRALRTLEQERDLPRTPIIALTANARSEDIQASLDAGCDAHLSKPLSKAKLLETVGQHVTPLESRHPSGAEEQTRIHVPAGFEQVVPHYLAARKGELELSTRALAVSNFEQIRTLAHNWKGTGSSYGFDELTTLGAAIEDSARHHDSAALKTQLAELERYLCSVELA